MVFAKIVLLAYICSRTSIFLDMNNIEQQLRYYKENEESLLNEYEGTFLIISDGLKVDAFSTMKEAYDFGCDHYGIGNFLLKECKRRDVRNVKIITPRVVVL